MGSCLKSSVRALAIAGLSAAALLAQNNRIAGPIDARRPALLRGNVNPIAQPQFDEGRVDSLLKMERITLLLKPTEAQQAALEQLLTEQQDSSSPNYHNWLTPEQYGDRFGLSAADIGEIVSWLKSQGFVVDEVARGRNWIAFSGTAGLVEHAFGTEIHHYRRNGELHFANAADPLIPAALEPLVMGLRGLDDVHPKPAHVGRQTGTAIPGLYPDFNFGGQHYLVPDDLATIYDLNPLYGAGFDGTGQKIVVGGQSSVDLTNINRFRSIFNLSVKTPQTVLVGPDPGQVSGDIDESYLDLEWAGAVARGATIIFVYAQDITTATQSAINQNLAPIISWSYGSCEIQNSPSGRQFFRSLAQQAVAQGITWVSSSGDSGAADCETQGDPQNNPVATQGISTDLPASVPEVTGVGGTRFNDGSGNYWNSTNGANSGSALSYIPEMAWNDTSSNAGLLASGGGASITFPKPVWQAGTGVPNDGWRDVPDVSLNASNHDGYIVCKAGSCAGAWPPQNVWVFGGTSASAPSFAGMLALLQQYLIANHFQSAPGLGNINPTLYRLAQNVPAVFHDIVSGNNIVPCAQNTPNCPASAPFSYGYSAGPGYDQVTGLGSVDGNSLITNWHTDLCTYSLSPSSANLASSAGSGSVTITTQSWCSWNALSDSTSWLTITSSSSGAGSGSVNYSVKSNATSSARTGALHISGQTFTITQNSAGASPSLNITKTHTGNFTQGQKNATYTVTVSNAVGAGSTIGTVTVTEAVPTGLTLLSMAGTGWTCPGTASNNCTRSTVLGPGASYPSITVTVNVASNAISPQVNSITVSGGGSVSASSTDTTNITGSVIGSVDTAGNANGVGTVARGATLYVAGWAADTVSGSPVQSVTVYVDGVSVGTATLGLARPDVANIYGRIDFGNSGWTFQMSTASLSVASHTVTVTAVGTSGTAPLGTGKTITITAQSGGGQVVGSLDAAGNAVGSPIVVKGATLYVKGWAADTASGAPVQSVTVFVDGASVGMATLGAARPDVANYFARADFTNSGWSLQMSTAALSVAAHTVSVTAVGTSGTAVLGSTSVTITAQSGGGQEIGRIDAAGDVSGVPTVVTSGTLWVRGWATDTATGAPVQSVTILVDGSSVGTAVLGATRPDVASAFARSDYTNSGWTFNMPASSLSTGGHTVTATGVGPSGTAQFGGVKTITISTQSAPGQEIGSLDSAGDVNGAGTVVKGQTLYVRGWAADTVSGAPVQSVTVFVDGASVGTAVLGLARPDVAAYFGRSDYTNSGWSFQASTAALSTGQHTVTATIVGPSGSAQLPGKSVTIQ